MKKKVFLIAIALILLVSGSVLAAWPKLILKCDGVNCILSRNFFGQIIQARYKFTYSDVQICEVKPVKTIAENGEFDVKNYTLRIKGDNIKYTPEWVSEDNDELSKVCTNFFKKQAFDYKDKGIFQAVKSLWALFVICGAVLIRLAVI